MIRLKHILTEISLHGVQPYATKIAWTDKWDDQETFESQFQADGQPILLRMDLYHDSKFGDSGEWHFSFFVQNRRTADRNHPRVNWTTSADSSAAAGELNTLRLFKTIGLAIRDFADTHAGVDVIDITGGDNYPEKEFQKSRIYARFIASNPELSDFRVEHGATKLFLVRRPGHASPDASGIDTPNNPDM
jgi:hypothetical protein